ncbi:MAG: TRAM domain-containing protein [Actinomycetota bacterium]
MRVGEHLRLRTERPVAGGRILARADDGRVALVEGALPGEEVEIELTAVHDRRVEGRAIAVVDPAAGRVEPPCPHVAGGCGGCDWQHLDPQLAPAMRSEVVVDAARHLSGIDLPSPVSGPAGALADHRTTVRFARTGSRVGLRRASSDEVVPIDRCLVAHPLVDEVVAELDPGEADELTVRVGARTGERLVLADPTASGVRAADGVLVVGLDELLGGRRAWIHDEVAGRSWRISARSFFQSGPAAAEALVDAVTAAAEGAGDRMLDLYAGVGLFAGTVGVGRDCLAVERSPDAVADARINLGDARVVRSDVRRYRPRPVDLAVVDPARSGLGKQAADVIVASRASVVVLVSCDAAAFGRDVKLLADRGYAATAIALVDAFPGTSHVEVVTRFEAT